MAYKLYICGGDYSALQDRGDCPDSLHDWPLPDGYAQSFEVANARLRNRWSNRRCRLCNFYGWAPSDSRPDSTNPIEVPYVPTAVT